MKLAEFLGRRAEYEASSRRRWMATWSVSTAALVAAAVLWMSGPARLLTPLPRWLRGDLPGWALAIAAVVPLVEWAGRPRRLRRAGLTCGHCGQALAGPPGEVVVETTACPACRERVLEDGRRPDLDWAALRPVSIALWQAPRWVRSAPRLELQQRLRGYQRSRRQLVVGGLMVFLVAGLVGVGGRVKDWEPRGARRTSASFREEPGVGQSSLFPGLVKGMVTGVGGAMVLVMGVPWYCLHRHERLLRRLDLRCSRCAVPLPPRAGLAVALGRCGSCGAPVR